MPQHFRFDVLWLLSESEQRARKIVWAKNTTALIGGNHTGKSTLLRMLYFTFGCNTRPLGAEWDPRTLAAVTFSIGDLQFTMLRRQSLFALFDSTGALIWATTDQGDVRTHFSELVSFVLPLLAQQGQTRQARPSFFFLPLFVDQDGSWSSSWQTFQSLGEFKDWQKPTIELMLGIRGSEYWSAFGDFAKSKTDVEALVQELKVLENTKNRLAERFPSSPWFRDALTFRRELSSLEEKVASLTAEQHRIESYRSELRCAHETLRSQISLIEGALSEHAADMRFLDERRRNGEIVCPTCGTAHENSFHSRLNLEAEADDLRQLRAHFDQKLSRVNKDLQEQDAAVQEITKQTEAVEDLLNAHRGELKLRQIVERAGNSKAHAALDEQILSVNEGRVAAERRADSLQHRLADLNDPVRAKQIVSRFREYYSRFATLLAVPASLTTHKRQVHFKPSYGGSGGPRAILAYYFAIAHTAEESSLECVPPLVVDSPHQQAQDEIRSATVTEFIFNNRPVNQQLIVGLEDPPPASVVLGTDDRRYDLTEQFHVLSADEYEEVFSFVDPKWRVAKLTVDSDQT